MAGLLKDQILETLQNKLGQVGQVIKGLTAFIDENSTSGNLLGTATKALEAVKSSQSGAPNLPGSLTAEASGVEQAENAAAIETQEKENQEKAEQSNTPQPHPGAKIAIAAVAAEAAMIFGNSNSSVGSVMKLLATAGGFKSPQAMLNKIVDGLREQEQEVKQAEEQRDDAFKEEKEVKQDLREARELPDNDNDPAVQEMAHEQGVTSDAEYQQFQEQQGIQPQAGAEAETPQVDQAADIGEAADMGEGASAATSTLSM